MAHFPAPAAPRRTPCNIITGPLGAGKSSAIVHLLASHSDGNWAVLVNEIGDVGIDGAIAKSSGADGSAMVAEIAGGCICCANGVAATRLWEAGENYRDMVHASDVLVLNRRDVDEAKTVDVEHWARELYPPKAVREDQRRSRPICSR
ncbi:cobW C-terminal domain-containing protein [Aureococcus anophagefferens]|nr:cobW C-terminal domain-containing protein [Aureococcus anophagefferens]